MIVKKITLSLVEYSTLECGIFKKFEKTIIKVNWDFSQTPKQIYRKLQHEEKIFVKFQSQPRFHRKMVLCIRWPNLALQRFEPKFHGSGDLIYTFHKSQNKLIANSDIQRKILGILNVCLVFPENWFCIRRASFAFLGLVPTLIRNEDSI